MNLDSLVGLAGAPLVQGLVELVKRSFPTLEARWYPAIAVFWGIVLNLVLAYLLAMDLRTAAVVGVATGLLASGLFAAGKTGETTVPHL